MFKVKKEVKKIKKYLRRARRDYLRDNKNKKLDMVGYTLCIKSLSQIQYSELERECKKRKIILSVVDTNWKETKENTGIYWFRVKI